MRRCEHPVRRTMPCGRTYCAICQKRRNRAAYLYRTYGIRLPLPPYGLVPLSWPAP